jgi:hypothetical protein
MAKNKHKRRTPKKPTGQIGPLLTIARDRSSSFTPIKWPESKLELERYILAHAVRSAANAGSNLYDLSGEPKQNPEQDFDFTLQTARGLEYLDLMEIAPLAWVGGPHHKAPASYNHGEFSDAIYEQVLIKSRKYGSPSVPIHLLLYPTDWRLRVSVGVQNLLSYMCRLSDHSFKTIVYYSPDDQETGEVIQIYPRPSESFKQFSEAQARNRATMLGDFSRVTVEKNGTVRVPLAPLIRRPRRLTS